MNDDDRLITDISDEEMMKMYAQAQKSMRQAEEFNAVIPNCSNVSEDETAVDEYGMPFEPESFYISTPLEFEEEASWLWMITGNMHYAATRYNRHSPNYYLLCAELEKNIKQLGSYCITEAVLEKAGIEFQHLDNLSIEELFCMVSLHFRKCCAAYMDIQATGGGQDLNVIHWVFRWANLADRLRSTQEKIQKIQDGKIKIESILRPAQPIHEDKSIHEDSTMHRLSPIRKAQALPVNKSCAHQIEKMKREEEKAAERLEREQKREMERAAKRLEKSCFKASEVYHVPTYRPRPIPIRGDSS